MEKIQNKKLVLVLVLPLLLTVSLVAAIIVRYRYPIQGNVTVTAYELSVWETDGITAITTINFGNVIAGETSLYDIIVENTGDYNANLELESNLAAIYGSVSWNYTGAMLFLGESMPLQLNLTLTPDCPRGTLTFALNVTAWTG